MSSPLHFTPATVGCHWFTPEYTISTQTGGGEPSGYVLYYDRAQVGPRYVSLDEAKQAATDHATRMEATK